MTNEVAAYHPDTQRLDCQGDWDVTHLPSISKKLDHFSWPKKGTVTFNGESIHKLDSAGAWLLIRWRSNLEKKGVKVSLQAFSKEHAALIDIVQKKVAEETGIKEPPPLGYFAQVGKTTLEQIAQASLYLSFIGKLTYEALRVAAKPSHIRWNSLTGVVYRNGFQALPIIALLSFMIGVVITYQMGLQLRNYGANVFIVDLLGLAVLREFGPLLTAIMVAGRTGSAFTAQLGIMKINQEIDALDTMGVTPAELLLLPRIVGLFIALPLLTMWADIFGVVGGMVMANNMLNITWYDFLHRFPSVIPLRAFLIGLGKAPVFALLIASIGCFEGMQVEGSADSVGRNTTRSVVLSIFFIIVADAIFSIIFSKLKL